MMLLPSEWRYVRERRRRARWLCTLTILGHLCGIVSFVLWCNRSPAWLLLGAWSQFVDATDGMLARWLECESLFGAFADRIGDCIIAALFLYAMTQSIVLVGVLFTVQMVCVSEGWRFSGRFAVVSIAVLRWFV